MSDAGSQATRGLLVSDFTITNLADLLNNQSDDISLSVSTAPFGQVEQVLMQESMPCWHPRPGFVLVWTRPESVIPSFARLLNYEPVPPEQILLEVDRYAQFIAGASQRTDLVLIPEWVVPHHHRGWGLIDLKPGIGISHMLMEMNLRLARHFGESPSIFVLNAQRWIQSAGRNAENPKWWYMGKVAFDTAVFREAARDITSALRSARGESRKIVLVDLDDTLWGGIVGDVGWENITLGGHDPIGEAYRSFQESLKALKNRGILLGIISKNEESVALNAIASHPEMALHIDDFVGYRINWDDKAENILELIDALKLGLQSVVFIDDNPVERNRVKGALPEVLVPEWPKDPMLYASTLQAMNCFDSTTVSNEDARRTEMYSGERVREQLRTTVGSIDEWLRSLDIEVQIEPLHPGNLQRVTQLLNKTNQLNLRTRRMTAQELTDWLELDTRTLASFRVRDRFGDSGITGILSIEICNDAAEIADFVLSCRVMGRQIEEAMLYVGIEFARMRNLPTLVARYIPTAKNKPCLDFIKRSGMDFDALSNTARWELSKPYSRPAFVRLSGGFAEMVLSDNVEHDDMRQD